MIFFLIGNKSDLEEERQVTKEEAEKMAKLKNLIFIEVSAKKDTNIEHCFKEGVKRVLEDIKSKKFDPYSDNNGVWVGVSNYSDNIDVIKKKKKNCC